MLEDTLAITVLILLVLFLYSRLKRIFSKTCAKIRNNCLDIHNRHESLSQECAIMKNRISEIEKKANQTIALYDVTKEICRYLEIDKIFAVFKDQLDRHIKTKDCRFIKEGKDLTRYKDYEIIPLEIEKKTVGYLLAEGIEKDDQDSFHILAQQFILGIKRAHLYQKIQELAINDGLTGIFSRGYYLARLREEIERSEKFKLNFSLALVDIDNFRTYNDRYGHLVGDSVLKEVVRLIKENIRQIDLLGKYGGDEISLVLIETNKQIATQAAERIRHAIEEKKIKAYDEDLQITVSIGIAGFPSDAQQPEGLIAKADQALYLAKQSGKNKVSIYQGN